MESIIETHQWSKWRDQLTVGVPRFPFHTTLHLRLREHHHSRGSGGVQESENQDICIKVVSSICNHEALTTWSPKRNLPMTTVVAVPTSMGGSLTRPPQLNEELKATDGY